MMGITSVLVILQHTIPDRPLGYRGPPDSFELCAATLALVYYWWI